MDESQLRQSRISKIETLWSIVRRAHDDDLSISKTAQEKLLEIYGGAIKRYLLSTLRDETVAHDLYQEFALKLIKGDFHRTAPEKGKFRFFVKTVTRNLIRSHFRKQNRHSQTGVPMEEIAQLEEGDKQDYQLFGESWREDLLFRTWQSLAEHQQKTGVTYYSVLNLRVTHPELDGDSFAEKLSNELGRQVNPATARVQLHRAREKFANLLIDDVANSLEDDSRNQVEQELIELGLMEYCRPAFENYQDGQ